MSTVFYGVEIDKEKFWDTMVSIRRIYVDQHPIYSTFDKEPKRFYDLMKENPKSDLLNEMVELQVFDFGTTLVFRVLENGFFFWNNIEKFPNLTERVVDTRSDGPRTCSEEMVDEIDRRIRAEQYFTYRLVSVQGVTLQASLRHLGV